MKPSSFLTFAWLLILVLLASCTASEKAARQERKERFHAERAARKGGKREIVKHKIGEDPKLASDTNRRDKKGKKKKQKKSSGWFGQSSKTTSGKRPGTATSRNYSNKDVATVVKTARSYIGTPYRDAGTTRIGMDCSGLTLTSYQAIDLALPRNSRDQSNFGSSISINQLREGDLVFFGPSKNSSQITHVGMVTEVKGREEVTFIHSSSSLGVIENNLYSRYYIERFVKASRPLEAKLFP